MKRSGQYGHVSDFSVDHDSIDINDVLAIQKHLIKTDNTK